MMAFVDIHPQNLSEFVRRPQMSVSVSSADSLSTSLVAGLRDGNDEAWRRLVDIYAPLVRIWYRYAGVGEDRIADILQEVFLAVHRSIGKFSARDDSTGFRGWVWMITRNKIRDHFRNQSQPANPVGGSTVWQQIQEVEAPNRPVDAPSQPSDTAALLHRALAYVKVEFRDQTWDAFWRTTVLCEATDRVAEEFGNSAAAVRQSRSRVLRRLRQQLGDVP
jgi:RNA polymerase sigma-70 factor (ECF subfamily)